MKSESWDTSANFCAQSVGINFEGISFLLLSFIMRTFFRLAFLFFVFVQTACGQFQELDDRINNVAKKVVHLGDQLEGVNTTRSRAADAHQLMGYFAQLHSSMELTDEVFTDASKVFFIFLDCVFFACLFTGGTGTLVCQR